MAVIHGYGANDWRDPEATQTFVLKNVVGNDLKVHSGKEFVTANSGRKLPRPQGDLIGETVQGLPDIFTMRQLPIHGTTRRPLQALKLLHGVFHKPRTMK